jgi:hypothetical protein
MKFRNLTLILDNLKCAGLPRLGPPQNAGTSPIQSLSIDTIPPDTTDCIDTGVHRTIWTAANKNKSCADESRVILTTTTILTESAQILLPKKCEEESQTAGSSWDELLSCNKNTVLIFLSLTVFVLFVTVIQNIIFFNSRRESSESLVSKNGTKNSKRYFLLRIPLFSSFTSSDSFAEKYVTHSVLSSEDRSGSCSYERIVEKVSSDEIP